MSSALTGRFTTTGPRGKSYVLFHTDIGSLTDSDPWPGLPGASVVKKICLPRQETWVLSLG